MISIIMPLYNAERFLQETLQSIQKQTYRDYELICINDASTDATMDILKSAQARDARIRIYSNEERCGAAKSRNIGISKAKGEYITFLDGDDIFEEEMLLIAYTTAKREALDVLIYEYKHVDSEKIYNKKTVSRSKEFVEKYCIEPFSVMEQSPDDFLSWTTSPWNKLYRREFVTENQLEFQTLNSSNDVYFVTMALFLAERVMMLNDRRVMVYARDHFTPTRISVDRDPMCVYQAMEKVLLEMKERKVLDKLYKHYYLKLFFILKNGFVMARSEEKKERFYKFLKEEGIARIKILGEEYYNRLDEDIKEMIARYEQEDYASKWFMEGAVLSYFLQKTGEKVARFIQDYDEVIVWGAGINGKTLLQFLNQKKIAVHAVVDMDAKKHGAILEQHEIENPKKVSFKDGTLVVVSAMEAYAYVYEKFASQSIKVIYIGDYAKE